MVKRVSAVAVLVGLGLVLGLSTLAFTQERPARPPRGGGPGHIHVAMRELQHVERQLERAEHVYGGHRAKALDLVKQAQKELQEALAYVRANRPKGTPATGSPPPAGTAPAPTAPAPATTAPTTKP